LRKSAVQLKTKRVLPGGPAERAGILPGSVLLRINRRPVRDVLDFRFYSADRTCDCVFLQDGAEKTVRFSGNAGRDAGLEFEPMEFARCGNKCLFCFSDQNPEGLRKTLYFKDEDYRLSFLFGNYVTLTRVNEDDLRRIAEQNLSPLFVSVHAFDADVRKRLLGLNRDDRLWEKLRFLTGHGIELHGQIVLCPGINDGGVLDRTVDACAGLHPRFRSLAVVPVGLTRHRRRRGLPVLKRVGPETAAAAVKQMRTRQRAFKRKFGEPFVYLSDELYLLSGEPLPRTDQYGDFWQSENGVGMTSCFLDAFRKSARSFPKRLEKPLRVSVVTGELAGSVLEKHVLPVLNRITGLDARLCMVPNRFYGRSVTVSGLLTGGDIARSLKKTPEETVALLPSNCVNTDGLFLDGWTVDALSKTTGRRAAVLEDFESFLEAI